MKRLNILVLSDLHLEFAPFVPDPAAVDAADVVVLAGDICNGTKAIAWARQAFADKPVVYVAGNHEFYRFHWTKLLDQLREQARLHGVHFLEDDTVTIEGVRFLGATLWTDFALFGEDTRSLAMRESAKLMNDFHLIKARPLPVERTLVRPDGSPWKLSPAHTLRRHRETLAWLRAELPLGEPGRTVVVTHHLPSERSVAPRYKEDMLSAIYASRLAQDVLLGAAVWIHGHAHTSFDYRVEGPERSVRVVCNPRGYPLSRLRPGEFENPGFDPGLMVEA
ncbi:metallophosphoesterase [Polaromonas sp.]|uniref:metallophosphoesterase n=1 Tax=Polaromonas sp. TaxID=1869339 RepID=UPI003BB6BDC0